MSLTAPLAAAIPAHSRGTATQEVPSVDAIAEPLAALLTTLLAEKERQLTALATHLGDVTEEIRALLEAGGKRLRPAFVHWGHRAAGGADAAAVCHVAGAIELLHTFALLHDDVMDRSARRRGRPSAHQGFAAYHRRAGRNGDSEWFGVSAAILAGDLVAVWADELLAATPVPAPAAGRARAVYDLLRSEVMAGQYLDLLLNDGVRGDEAMATKVALLKSARYTVTRPLQLGAALVPGDPDPHTGEALAAYGDAVGIAFQLRDDVLGLFGDPAVTGKSNVDDLREGKRTVLMVHALREASPGQHRVLCAALDSPDPRPEHAAAVRAIVMATGTLAWAEERLDAERSIALAALSRLGAAGPAGRSGAARAEARDALAELATFAVVRER